MAGKIIAITGANGGLGRALAQRFAEEGETVILMGRKLDKVQEVAAAIGGNATAVACEVTSPDSVRAAFQEIADKHGRLDALINNAAIFQMFTIEQATDAQIVGGVLTNLAGPILCSRSAIPLLPKGGHIINITSESIEEPFPMLSVYQSTKGGLERFSKHLNRELFDKGIRVSVVRAGQMMGPGSSAEIDPEVAGVFFNEALKRGLNLVERGITEYKSTTQIFRLLLDLPPDIHVDAVMFQGRPAA